MSAPPRPDSLSALSRAAMGAPMKSTWTGRVGAVLVGLAVFLLGLGLVRVREERTAAAARALRGHRDDRWAACGRPWRMPWAA